jgi:hypothetical protein
VRSPESSKVQSTWYEDTRPEVLLCATWAMASPALPRACGPKALNGRLCPVEQEQLLFKPSQHIVQRDNTAMIFQRGLDRLMNSDSLEIFLLPAI